MADVAGPGRRLAPDGVPGGQRPPQRRARTRGQRVERAIAELGYRPNIAARALVTGSTRTIGLVTVQDQPVRPGADDARAGEGRPRGRLLAQRLDPGRRDRGRDARGRGPLRRPAVDARRRAEHLRRRRRGAARARAAGAAGRRPGGRRRGPARRRRRPGDRRPPGHPPPARPRPPHGAPRRRPGGLAGGPRPHRRAGARSSTPPAPRCPELLRGRLDAVVGLRGRASSSPPGSAAARTSPPSSSPTTRWRSACSPRCTRRASRCPDDVSVVGFDDLPEAPYFTPPLTTVRQDFAELGRRGRAARARPAARRGPAPRPGPGHPRRAVQHRHRRSGRDGPAPGPAGDTGGGQSGGHDRGRRSQSHRLLYARYQNVYGQRSAVVR